MILAKFKAVKRHKSLKPNVVVTTSGNANPCSLIPSTPTYISDNTSVLVPNNVLPTATTYSVTMPSDGIDLSTFRMPILSSHKPRSNITSIISKSIESKMIQLSQCSSSTSIINSQQIKTYDQQPTISSFFRNQNKSESYFGSVSCLSYMHNKSRCVLEDFVMLPKGQSVELINTE